MSDKELSVEEVLTKSSRKIEIFIDSMADSLKEQDVVPEAIKTTVGELVSAKWPERVTLIYSGVALSELLEKMAEKDNDATSHYVRLEEIFFENNPQICKFIDHKYFADKVRRSEFEFAYGNCFWEDWGNSDYEKSMGKAYENPNFALKKMYARQDCYKQRGKLKDYEEAELREKQEREAKNAYVFVATAYRNGVDIEPELAYRFFSSDKNVKALLGNLENRTNKEKLKFIKKYGALLEAEEELQEIPSNETYGKLSSFVRKTFDANKDKFKDDRDLFVAGISILECSNNRPKSKMSLRSDNAMTLVDMFKYCGETGGCTFGFSFIGCPPIDSAAVEYVSSNLDSFVEDQDDRRWIKNLADGTISIEEPVRKKRTLESVDYLKNKKDEIRKRLAAGKKDKVSGAVVADRIAEAQISGVIDEPVTPEKGKKLSDSIKRKILAQKQIDRS